MTTEKKKRGFAAMDPVQMAEIARLGGRAAHAQGKAHKFTSEEGRAAGKKRAAQRAAQMAEAIKAKQG
jgi:general stress protein YciG